MTFLNVVIPVCSLHRSYIQQCINSIRTQTRIPDKIILVLNEYDKYNSEYETIMINNSDCTFIKINTWEKAGINRNIGSKECKDGIILYQDVDDIMHPQRCEIVEKCFELYDCDLLLHEYVQLYNYTPFKKMYIYDDKSIEENIIKSETIMNILNEKTSFEHGDAIINFSHYFGNTNNKNGHSNITNGECCVKAKILKENENIWTNSFEAEDIRFINDITRKYKNTFILTIPLVVIVGNEHIRLIDNKVCHKKSHKILNYDPVLSKSGLSISE